jgi:O-succinylbenzoate synthase
MIIRGIELIEIHLPLREPFVTGARAWSDRKILLLRCVSEDGVEGWGECVAGETPSYSYETTETAWHLLTEHLLPQAVGREILSPEEIMAPVSWIRGHPMAKAAMEMALWDLQAKEQETPLWEILGGSGDGVSVGVSIGLQGDDHTLFQKIEEYLDRGYARVKLKIRPGRDVAMVQGVRDRFPDLPLIVDGNSAYTLEDRALLREFDYLKVMMIEQPLGHADILDHARLQELIETPICLDESIGSEADARMALDAGACRIINIKAGRVGGLLEARRIHDLCRGREVPVWCGGMLESGIGRAHNLALATLPGFTLPGDISESRRYWERDIVTPEFELIGGKLIPSGAAGIGVEPDRLRIRELTARSVHFGVLPVG